MTTREAKVLSKLLAEHYAGEETPVRDFLEDVLPDGHRYLAMARTGVWTGCLKQWLLEGPVIVRRVPLRPDGLVFTDKKPLFLGRRDDCAVYLQNKYCWYLFGPHYVGIECPEDIPIDIFPENGRLHWQSYDSEKIATDTLSKQAINQARRRRVRTKAPTSSNIPLTE